MGFLIKPNKLNELDKSNKHGYLMLENFYILREVILDFVEKLFHFRFFFKIPNILKKLTISIYYNNIRILVQYLLYNK
jgi:hypothetical protein